MAGKWGVEKQSNKQQQEDTNYPLIEQKETKTTKRRQNHGGTESWEKQAL